MTFSQLPFSTLNIVSKEDLQRVVHELVEPLLPHFSAGSARVRLGATGASYSKTGAELEAFARILWGIAPLLAGGGSTSILGRLQAGIENGTNPEHPEYWGILKDYDQRAVEMAAIGVSIALCPEHFWSGFSMKTQANLSNWLGQINHVRLNDNNWLFFRVLVNLGLRKVGAKYDWGIVERDLEYIERFYLDDGWYSDGTSRRPPRRDYYVAFALYYYGLLYAVLMEEEDTGRSQLFKERAELFARDFIYWFSADGSAIPFGRSLTYRFAQGAFWGALAYAGVEAFPWGVVKGLILRHIRWWLQRPIFTESGLLSIGYGYPSLFISEQYNSYGSPYWAMKFFLPLALSDNHPIWKTAELPLPELEKVKAQPHSFFIICREPSSNHVFTLAGGQFNDASPRHVEAKYSKFAYSSHFGFSVPTAQSGLSFGAYDSMLALSEDGEYFRVRRKCEKVELQGNVHYSKWLVWDNVAIETWLIPLPSWHIRIHRIDTKRKLITAEGGFALGIPTDDYLQRMEDESDGRVGLCIYNPKGVSGIINSCGDRESELIRAAPNSNLFEGRTAIPTLKGNLSKGNHILVSAVLGSPEWSRAAELWLQAPKIEIAEGTARILHSDRKETVLIGIGGER